MARHGYSIAKVPASGNQFYHNFVAQLKHTLFKRAIYAIECEGAAYDSVIGQK